MEIAGPSPRPSNAPLPSTEPTVARSRPDGLSQIKKYRPFIYLFVSLLFVFQILKLASNLPSDLAGSGNFPPFYRTGVMLRAGERHNLFNYDAQRRFELRMFPSHASWVADPHYQGTHTSVFLYFYHPPYQAIFLWPFAFFSYRMALYLWMIAGIGALLLSAPVLRSYFPEVRRLSGVAIPLIFLAFWPVAQALPEGQDSLFLFALVALAFHQFVEKKDYSAGAILGLAFFKFQFIIPILAILFFRRRYKVALGAAAVGVAVVIASWALIGNTGMLDYWQMLRFHGPDAGFRMPNIRGLMEAITGGYAPVSTIVVSLLAVVWAALGRVRNRADEFCAAIAATILVSYHMHDYDMVLLLLPVMVLFERAARERNWAGVILPGIFYFAFLQPVLARLQMWYLYALPVAAMLFVFSRGGVRQTATNLAPESEAALASD